MKITDRVYFYQTPGSEDLIKSSNTVLIVGAQEQAMIDPGIDLRGKWNWLKKEMKKDGLDVARTTQVWLTHSHFDHSHLVGRISKEFKVKVGAHWLAKEVLEARNPFKVFEDKQRKAGKGFLKIRPFFKWSFLFELKNIFKILIWKQFKVDHLFFGGEKILIKPLKIQILSLPGHCPDEIGFWIPKQRVLIIGDLIHPMNNGRTSIPVLNNFLSDIDQAVSSIKRMKRIKLLRPKILLPAHGEKIIGRKNIRLVLNDNLLQIESYKKIAKEFIEQNSNLDKVSLVKKLAKLFFRRLPANTSSAVIYQMRFTAFAILKSLGVIK